MFYLETFLGSYLVGIYPLTWVGLQEDIHLILYLLFAIAIGGLLTLVILSLLLILGILAYRGSTLLWAVIKVQMRRLLDLNGFDSPAWLIDKQKTEES